MTQRRDISDDEVVRQLEEHGRSWRDYFLFGNPPCICSGGKDGLYALIIEDDDVIAQGMARHLTAAGFDAVGVANGETGLARLRYEQPDVCVLDLMLPGIDGWRVIEQARGEGIGTPIVVVSARGTEHDRINALELGADDYLVKPFSMKELAARVAAASPGAVVVTIFPDGGARYLSEPFWEERS